MRRWAWTLVAFALGCTGNKLPDVNDDIDITSATGVAMNDDESADDDDSASDPMVGESTLRVTMRASPHHDDPDTQFCSGTILFTIEADGQFTSDGECWWTWAPSQPGFIFEATGRVSSSGEVDGSILVERTGDPDTNDDYPLDGTFASPAAVLWYGEAVTVTDDPVPYLGQILED